MPDQYLPIRKVAAAFIAAGIVYVAHQLGVDLGDQDADEAALALIPVIVAYVVKN